VSSDPRVLVVTNMWPRPERPAFGSFVASQVEALRAAGAHVQVHVIAGDRHASAYVRDIPLIRRLAHGADVVHAHFGLAGWTASWQPLPLVVSFCGTDLLGLTGLRRGRHLTSRVTVTLSHWAARRAAAIICKSENLRQALPRIPDRSRAVILPNGVDLQRFTPGDQREARTRLGLPLEARFALFPYGAARLEKRPSLAQAAVERAVLVHPSLRLLQVDGAPPGAMPDYYRAADCLLLTSAYEGSPNTVKEALACGLPVVSVDVGDVRHWLGAVHPTAICTDDADDLARGLDHVLTAGHRVDPTVLRPELDAQRSVERLLAIYKSVSGASRRRS